MKKVREIMSPNCITLTPEMEISQAAGLLLDNHINGAPVVDAKGALAGILCQSDLVIQQKRFPVPSLFTLLDGLIPLRSSKNIEKEINKMAAAVVSDAMTADVTFLSPDSTVEEAATLMVEKKFHTIPVVEDGKLVGVVGKEDILREVLGRPRPEPSEAC